MKSEWFIKLLNRFIQINKQDVAFTAKQLFISAREHANARWISFCRDNTFIIILTMKKEDHQREDILRQLGIHRYQRTVIEPCARIKSQQKHGIQQRELSSNCLLFGGTDSRNGRHPRSQGPGPGPGNGRFDSEEMHSWPRPQQWQRRPRPSRYVSGGRA